MAEISLTFKLEGMEEFADLLNEIREDYGEKDAKKILTSAMKDAMQPVLMLAQSMAPVDTGALRASLRVEARRPSGKDKRSRYVMMSDTIIGTVTTAPGNVLAKRSFVNLHAPSGNRIKQVGIKSDARANVQEFGTHSGSISEKRYMRTAMQSRGALAASDLGKRLGERLEKYKARQARKAK